MADEATLRECAVCDVKTTSACGRCGLPFCSREHQKLLWKTHKWLCGKDPDVSSLPPLDEEEVEALLACSKSEGTLKDYLGQPISFADFEVFVESRLSTSWRLLTFTTLFKPPPFEQQEPLLSLSIARLDSPAQSIGGPSMLQLKKTAERLVRSIWEKTRAVGGG
ncbi:hypothetical protein JCM10213_008459 [Rhodosporidiobolus nylandii]